MSLGNGRDGADGRPAAASSLEPLSKEASTLIRRGVGRLISGANELAVIALVSPVFLLGVLLAVEGASAAKGVPRDRLQRGLDLGLFVAYGVTLIALAIRARWGASRARKILPDALSDDRGVRAAAKERLLRIAGPAPVRRLADRVAARGCLLTIVLALGAVVGWIFLRTPDPIWLVVFVGTAVAIDVRWRALVADAADQMR